VMLHGSWPPQISRFSTQLMAGHSVTVGSETRTVSAVHSDQLIELELAFDQTFSNAKYTISNIPGTGLVNVTAGAAEVFGVVAASSQFDTELRLGDLVSMDGHYSIIVTVDDQEHATVLDSFPSGVESGVLQLHTLHSALFTVAQPVDGLVYTIGSVLYGVATYFGQQLQAKFNLQIQVNGHFETRNIDSIASDTQLQLNEAFSSDIPSSAQQVLFFESCSSQLPDTEPADSSGTFALHAATLRPKVCFSTGHCAPRSTHSAQFELQGTGSISVAYNSTQLIGEHSVFGTQVQPGNTVSVLRGAEHQSRVVTRVQSDTELTLDSPFSFEIEAWFEQEYLIRPVTGKGTISNPSSSNTVSGTGTQFNRDLRVGWVVAAGLSKRLVTSITSDTQLMINAPFGDQQLASSAWSFDSCIDDSPFPDSSYAEESCELVPGCCGMQVYASILPEQYAYYMVQPTSANQVVRVQVSSPSHLAELQVTLGVGAAPDDLKYDFKAVGQISPWHVELPHQWMQCVDGSCAAVYIGIKGPPTIGLDPSFVIPYTVSAYSEFSFKDFSCSNNTALHNNAVECQQRTINPLGSTVVIHDPNYPNQSSLRLTAALPFQTGAAWFDDKLHLEDGFETSFKFRLESHCTQDGAATNCAAGDGFGLVLFGGEAPTIGCGNSALGFGSQPGSSECTGLWPSFVVEFDTYHNPELRDINSRGTGTTSVNATEVLQYNYEHAAFFAFDEAAGTASHDEELAGTPAIPSIADGEEHMARLVYIPGSTSSSGRIFLYIDDMQSFVLTASLRLARAGTCTVPNAARKCVLDDLGNAFIGFTAATGESGQQHDITEWHWCDEPNCGR